MKKLIDIIEGLKVNSKTKINSNDISDLYTIIYYYNKLFR